jgi:hypothetical protein
MIVNKSLCAVVWAAAAIGLANIAQAEDGGLPCEMGTQKWDPKTAVCVPRQPPNWVGCTGLPWSGKGGQWKETGIPCSNPPPNGTADYLDTTEVPHPPPPAADAKRVIDLFRGVLFVCVPEPKIDWTPEACTQIVKEWKRQANATNLPNAVLDIGSDAAAKQKKADEVGIPPGGAVEWRLWFAAGRNVVSLKEEMSGVLEVLPGIYGRKTILVGGELEMRPDEAKPAFALAGAKREIEAQFQFLLGPR